MTEQLRAECNPLELAADEQRMLAELEHTIEAGLRAFMRAGAALITIRDQRLYRATHAAFPDYCRERWGMTDVHANRLIAAYETTRLIESKPIGSVPSSESVARPLTRLADAAKVEAWTVAVETAPTGQPTAAHVAQVVATYGADIDAELAINGWWHETTDAGVIIHIDADTQTPPSASARMALARAYPLARLRRVERERAAEVQARAELEATPMPAIPADLAAAGWVLHRTMTVTGGILYYGKRAHGPLHFQTTQTSEDLAAVVAEMSDPELPAALVAAGWRVVMAQSNWWYAECPLASGILRTGNHTRPQFATLIADAQRLQAEYDTPQAEPEPSLPDALRVRGWVLYKNTHGWYARNDADRLETNAGDLDHVADQARAMQARHDEWPELPAYLTTVGWQLRRQSHGVVHKYIAALHLGTEALPKGSQVIRQAERIQADLEARILTAMREQGGGEPLPEVVIKGWSLDRMRGLVQGLLSKDGPLHWTQIQELEALANALGA